MLIKFRTYSNIDRYHLEARISFLEVLVEASNLSRLVSTLLELSTFVFRNIYGQCESSRSMLEPTCETLVFVAIKLPRTTFP